MLLAASHVGRSLFSNCATSISQGNGRRACPSDQDREDGGARDESDPKHGGSCVCTTSTRLCVSRSASCGSSKIGERFHELRVPKWRRRRRNLEKRRGRSRRRSGSEHQTQRGANDWPSGYGPGGHGDAASRGRPDEHGPTVLPPQRLERRTTRERQLPSGPPR
jgi:hypothetical protein